MSPRPQPPDGLTREESLYLDGRLPPDDAKRLEHLIAAEPDRARRLEAYRSAMDAWRRDTQAHAQDPGESNMATRVLAAVAANATEPVSRAVVQGTRRYAVAALVLIAVSIGGTLMARGSVGSPAAPSIRPRPLDPDAAIVKLMIGSPELTPRVANLGSAERER